MTTQRQIKRFVAPLLERNPDLMHRRNWLYLKPVSNVSRFVKIASGVTAAKASPQAAVDFSFNNSDTTWDWLIGNREERLIWDNPAIHPVVMDRIEEALDRMRAVTTLTEFETFASKRRCFSTGPLSDHRDCQLRIDIAFGRLDAALVECRDLLALARGSPGTYLGMRYQRVAEPALPLLENGDIPGLVDLLRQWRNRYITLQNLESIFEPMPFPLEALV